MANELMVEEYKSLRQELLQLAASISRWQMVGFIVAGITLGTAFPWASYGALLLAAGLLIIAGCMFGVIHDLRSILRIAAYIQAIHEGRDTGAMWETRQELIAGVAIYNPLRPYMTPIPSLILAGSICAFGHVLTGQLLASWRGDYTSALPQAAMFVIWVLFAFTVTRSQRAFASGEFKHQTMRAFFDSLRQSGGNSTNDQI